MKLIIIVILTCSGLLAMDKKEKRSSAPVPKSIQRLLAGEKKLKRRRSVPIALDLSLLKKVESYEVEFARKNKEGKWDQEINYQEKAKKIKDKQKE